MGKGFATVLSAALAFGAGLATGMLVAPRSGAESRRKIGEQLKSYSENLEKQLNDVEDSLSKVEKQVVETGQALRSRVREAATRVRDRVEDVAEEVRTRGGDGAEATPEKWDMDRGDLAHDLPKMPKV